MFTSPLPLILDRYQFRLLSVVAVDAREDDALKDFVQNGQLSSSDHVEQATNRDGTPQWNVTVLIRERETGKSNPVVVRVASSSKPHEDIAPMSYVTFDELNIEWTGRGRHAAQFSYRNMQTTEPGQSERASGAFMQYAVNASGLLVEVEQVSPKKDREKATAAVVKAARDQGVDLDDLLPQKTNSAGVLQWSLESLIVAPNGQGFSESITVTSAEKPNVSGPISVDVLLIAAGETGQYPNTRPWVSLGAPNITSTPTPADRGNRRNRPEPAPEQNTEHAEANA